MDTNRLHDELCALTGELTSPLSPFPTDENARLQKLSPLKAVLFDIYGTLLISGTGDIGIAEEKNNDFPISGILESQGMKLLCQRDVADERFSILIKRFIREDHVLKNKKGIIYPEVDIREIWKKIISSMKDDNYLEGSPSERDIAKAALSYECLVNPVWPMPGAEKLLCHMYASTMKLGIVSNAQFYTEPILKRLLNIRIDPDHFSRELLFYSYEKNEAKPSADFFNGAVLKLKKMYNIEPDEILYIGNDMLNDVYTASSCGCKTALFAGDRRSLRLRVSDDRCKNLEPDLVVTRLDQLIDIL